MSEPKARSGWRSLPPVLQIVILVGVTALSGAIGYTAGQWMGHGKLRDARAGFQTERADLEERRSSLESELLEARAAHATEVRTWERKNQVLEARRQLAMAIESLDDRNFGTASARLSTASALLDRDSQSDALRDLAVDLGGSELHVSDDLADARSTVRGFASRLDATLSGAAPSPRAAPTAAVGGGDAEGAPAAPIGPRSATARNRAAPTRVR